MRIDELRERFAIIDSESGSPATSATYLSERQALTDIESWKRRQERGGRPDVTREKLDRLIVVPVSRRIFE